MPESAPPAASVLRRLRLVALAALCGATTAHAVEPVRIGLIAPLTGLAADVGTSMRDGASLAVDEVNAIGGVLGRPLELVIKDDAGDPATGRELSKAMVADPRIAATLGFCNTGVALKSVDVFEAARHVLIVPCAQGTAIMRRVPPRDSFVFRVGPSDEMSSRFLVEQIVARRGLTRIAILADTTAYGDGGIVDASAELKRRKLDPVFVGRYAADAATIVDTMTQAKLAGAEALMVYSVGPGAAVAARARAELKWDVPLYAPWALSFRSALERAGARALEGTMMTQSIIADMSNSTRRMFVSGYARHTGRVPIGSMMSAAQAYDSVQLLVRAMYATHGETGAVALKHALENPIEPYRGVVTVYDHPFSADDHEALSMNMLWLGVWRSGEIRYYHADDARLSASVRRKTAP